MKGFGCELPHLLPREQAVGKTAGPVLMKSTVSRAVPFCSPECEAKQRPRQLLICWVVQMYRGEPAPHTQHLLPKAREQAWGQPLAVGREGLWSRVLWLRCGFAEDPLAHCPSFREQGSVGAAHLGLSWQVPPAPWLLHGAQPPGLPVPAAALREA